MSSQLIIRKEVSSWERKQKFPGATQHFNPWIGCTKIAPGCTNCYAAADMADRRKRVVWGPNGTRSRTTDAYWRKPLKWNREAACNCHQRADLGEKHLSDCPQKNRTRVFCASLADVFEDWQGEIQGGGKDDDVLAIDDNRSRLLTMDDMRADLFKLIDATPNLDWLILTKRPENIRRMWRGISPHNWQDMAGAIPHQKKRKNVWLLASVSDQATADAMIPELLKARDLVPVLGVSAEPLLGPVDFMEIEDSTRGEKHWWSAMGTGTPEGAKLDWVITGGESGPHARPHNIRWSREIGQQCQAAGVAWFHKQHGSRPIEGGDFQQKTGPMEAVVLKHHAGADPAEWGDGWLQQMPGN